MRPSSSVGESSASSRGSGHSQSVRFQDEETGTIDYAVNETMLPVFLNNPNRPKKDYSDEGEEEGVGVEVWRWFRAGIRPRVDRGQFGAVLL